MKQSLSQDSICDVESTSVNEATHLTIELADVTDTHQPGADNYSKNKIFYESSAPEKLEKSVSWTSENIEKADMLASGRFEVLQETKYAMEQQLMTMSVFAFKIFRLFMYQIRIYFKIYDIWQALEIQSVFRGHMQRKRLSFLKISPPAPEMQILLEDVFIDGIGYQLQVLRPSSKSAYWEFVFREKGALKVALEYCFFFTEFPELKQRLNVEYDIFSSTEASQWFARQLVSLFVVSTVSSENQRVERVLLYQPFFDTARSAMTETTMTQITLSNEAADLSQTSQGVCNEVADILIEERMTNVLKENTANCSEFTGNESTKTGQFETNHANLVDQKELFFILSETGIEGKAKADSVMKAPWPSVEMLPKPSAQNSVDQSGNKKELQSSKIGHVLPDSVSAISASAALLSWNPVSSSLPASSDFRFKIRFSNGSEVSYL